MSAVARFFYIQLRPSLAISLGPRLFLIVNMTSVAAALLYASDLLGAAFGSGTSATYTDAYGESPLWMWSIPMLVGALLVFVGSLVPPRLVTMMAGHLTLGVVFLATGMGGLWQLAIDDAAGGWGVPAGIALTMGLMNFVYALAVEKRWSAVKQAMAERRRDSE